jgi:hypothetical protein
VKTILKKYPKCGTVVEKVELSSSKIKIKN